MAQAYDDGDLPRLAEVARAAAARWGLDPESAIDLLNLSENATYAIRAPGASTPVILRVGRPGYSSPAEIESELAWVDALREARRVQTAPVIPAPGGERVLEVASRPCVVFGFCPGAEPGEDAGHFERLGAVAARLHAHARAWAPPAGFVRRVWDERTTIGDDGHWGRWQDGMGIGPDELALLGRMHDALIARLAAYGKGPERFGLVHADMRLANLLFDGDDTYLIDFDDCGHSWFLYDLASALTFIEDREDVAELIAAWVRGYGGLPPQELEIVPTLIMLRRLLVLAWIGSHASTPLALQEGIAYTRATCALAERYLADRHGWLRLTPSD
jgi:Ser/Thr protein kinase RdoA (MazF antagonist)